MVQYLDHLIHLLIVFLTVVEATALVVMRLVRATMEIRDEMNKTRS